MSKDLLKYIPAFVIIAFFAIILGASQKSQDDFIYHNNLNVKLSSDQKELLILGDSRVMFSSNSDLIDDTKKGLNFAFPTNSYTKYYLDLVRSKIESSTVILIGISLESLTGRSNNISIKSFFSQFDRGFSLVNKLGIFSQMFFPSFDFSLLLQRRNPFSDYIRHKSRDVVAHTNGWSEYIGNNSDEARLVRHYENEFKIQPPRQDISFELQKFVKEMNQSTKRVFFFESPMSPEVLAAEKKGFPQRDMYLARLYSSLKSIGACHISISGRFKTYDGDHMISSEAKRFSKLLGEKIRNQDCEK